MKIILKKSCEEVMELLEIYSSLQKRVKQHVNKISECISCEKSSKISLEQSSNSYLENSPEDSEIIETS